MPLESQLKILFKIKSSEEIQDFKLIKWPCRRRKRQSLNLSLRIKIKVIVKEKINLMLKTLIQLKVANRSKIRSRNQKLRL